MELHVLVVKDRGKVGEILADEEVKRRGAVLRDNIDGSGRSFLVVTAGDELISRLLSTGVVELPEDEDKLVKLVKEEEERTAAGVGLLGL